MEPDDEPPPSSEIESEPPPGRRKVFDLGAAWGRLLVSAASGIVATLLTVGNVDLPLRVRAVVGWDTGALVFSVLAWMVIARASADETRRRAAVEDPGRRFVFVIALLASLFSLFSAVVVLHRIKDLPPSALPIWTALALAAVALSWVVTHTVFTLRYAHLYYRSHGGETHCLEFPGKSPPSDLDFAYFAFTIGMCFQVSDVVVKTRRARRAVLLHALMSFVYNTAILALSLNLVTSVLG